jgi:hypothetical protein
MPFVDFPEKKEPKKPKLKMQHTENGTFLKRQHRRPRVLRGLRKVGRTSTTSLDIPLLPKDRSFAGTKLTKVQAKKVNAYRAKVGKKNKKMVKQIWRKLF